LSFKSLSEAVKNILATPKSPDNVCPVCRSERTTDNRTVVRDKIANLAIDFPRWFEFFYRGDEALAFDYLTRGKHGWACDACLSSGAALLADYHKQDFCDWPPYLAYTDETLNCRTCQSEFIFTKEEQLYWYETLCFLVQSRAVNCERCRNDIRAEKKTYTEAQKQAQLLKASLDLTDIEQVSTLISLYDQTGSHKKVKYYTGILMKLKKNSQNRHNDNE